MQKKIACMTLDNRCKVVSELFIGFMRSEILKAAVRLWVVTGSTIWPDFYPNVNVEERRGRIYYLVMIFLE